MAFQEGLTVMKCEPFTYVVKGPYLETVCDFCMTTKETLNLKKLKKCVKCKMVNYCGKSCQMYAWKNHHKEECKYLSNTSNIFENDFNSEHCNKLTEDVPRPDIL